MTCYRWHTHPVLWASGDTIDRHQRAVADLCKQLAAAMGQSLADSQLIYAAKHHDEAERVLGDLPATAKRMFPVLRWAYGIAERAVLRRMGYTWTLTRVEECMLKLCDMLEAWTWARDHGVDLGVDIPAMKALANGLGPEAWSFLVDKLGQDE